jgi:uncharacterized membrane protein YhiD involved in acid resistance
MFDLSAFQTSSSNPTLFAAIYAILLAFALSALIGITYIKTFRGLSYSRNFIQAMMLGAIIAAMVIQAIGDSLAQGIGMMGALSIVRFRTNLRDSRDIVFMFAALGAGIACGTGSFVTALAGTAGFVFTAGLLYSSQLTKSTFYDGILRFSIPRMDTEQNILAEIMREHCKIFALITLRELNQGERFEYAYHVKLQKNTTNEALLGELQAKLKNIKGINLMLQETTVEL